MRPARSGNGLTFFSVMMRFTVVVVFVKCHNNYWTNCHLVQTFMILTFTVVPPSDQTLNVCNTLVKHSNIVEHVCIVVF